MDIEFNSDLDEIETLDLSSGIRPYMFEPVVHHRNGNITPDSDEAQSDEENDEYGGPGTDPSEWCECDNCQVMTTMAESQCCRGINLVNNKVEEKDLQCITQHSGFQANCLNIDVLETSYYEFIEQEGFPLEGQQIHETYRYIAYRRFVRWVWQKLPKKIRKVLPSCVVTKIREQFPPEEYCGFKYPVWD